MRYFTTLLAVAIAVCLCGTAVASPLNPPGSTAPDASSPSAAAPDLRNPDNRVAPGHPGQTPDTSSALADKASGVTDASTVPIASDDGLSTFLVVLLAVGGGVLVAGVGFAATRVVIHHHPHTLT